MAILHVCKWQPTKPVKRQKKKTLDILSKLERAQAKGEKNWSSIDNKLHKEHGNVRDSESRSRYFVEWETKAVVARIWWAGEHKHAVQDTACYFQVSLRSRSTVSKVAEPRLAKNDASEGGGPISDKKRTAVCYYYTICPARTKLCIINKESCDLECKILQDRCAVLHLT